MADSTGPGCDDSSSFGHVWLLEEVVIEMRSAELVSTCQRCGAISYEPSGSGGARRPPL